VPFCIDVLTLEGARIKEVTAFIARPALERPAEEFARFPDSPVDASKVVTLFERFGLPGRLD